MRDNVLARAPDSTPRCPAEVLEISPYEPPASGWTTRIKLLRRVMQEQGVRCEILDIGPSRRLERPDCVPVMSGRDYLRKVRAYARSGYTFHLHINGEYFRGLLLALAAGTIAHRHGNRCVATFHAGVDQPFLQGWRRQAVGPLLRMIFSLTDAVVCNSEAVIDRLQPLCRRSKMHAIPAFSRQYLEFRKTRLDDDLEAFLRDHSRTVSTYLCFRPGFFAEVLAEALGELIGRRPDLGFVIVGTGDDADGFLATLRERKIESNVHLAGDLDHDAFMTLLSRSSVHLRTPVTDGVSATVLEALALNVPVVASDNGTRPDGVITYAASSQVDMVRALEQALDGRDTIPANATPTGIADTAQDEIDLLLGTTE